MTIKDIARDAAQRVVDTQRPAFSGAIADAVAVAVLKHVQAVSQAYVTHDADIDEMLAAFHPVSVLPEPRPAEPDGTEFNDVQWRVIQAASDSTSYGTPSVQVRVSALAAAREALAVVLERLTANLTPALNTGTAFDALVMVAETLRQLRAALTDDPIPSLPPSGPRDAEPETP